MKLPGPSTVLPTRETLTLPSAVTCRGRAVHPNQNPTEVFRDQKRGEGKRKRTLHPALTLSSSIESIDFLMRPSSLSNEIAEENMHCRNESLNWRSDGT